MRAADVVAQLAVLLPQRTDQFTGNVVVSSLTRAGTTMTAVTAVPHDMEDGDAVAIVGATTQITIGSLTRSGEVGTLVTDSDHDLTDGVNPTITTSGAAESEFNGTFDVINVDNRRTVRFVMADAGATTATGSPILEDAESALRSYDSTFEVTTVPTPTSFTFEQPDTTLLDPAPTASIEARTKPRISAGVNPERILAAYTKKEVDELWLFAVLGDVNASKSRAIRSDAIDNLMPGDNFRQQIIQSVTLYMFVPAERQIAAATARDDSEDLFQPICQSVLGSSFDSGLFVGEEGKLQFVGHGTWDYNTSVYVHQYAFQQVVDLYEQDTVGPDLDVAFRNIDMTSTPELPSGQTEDTPVLTAIIDLDDVPL